MALQVMCILDSVNTHGRIELEEAAFTKQVPMHIALVPAFLDDTSVAIKMNGLCRLS